MTTDNDQTEAQRLQALQQYRLLDTAAETAFDDLAALAATLCDAPISLVSLIDGSRQWFKAKTGLESRETPREYAFCAHAIEQDAIMVVEDARLDSRFSDNPLVTGEPNIRFYAGAPLRVAGGSRLGTLCVIDTKPRQLSPPQYNALAILRDAVVAQCELRLAARYRAALENVLAVCAWCRRARVDNPAPGQHEWVSLLDYVSSVHQVTHSICPGCHGSLTPATNN